MGDFEEEEQCDVVEAERVTNMVDFEEEQCDVVEAERAQIGPIQISESEVNDLKRCGPIKRPHLCRHHSEPNFIFPFFECQMCGLNEFDVYKREEAARYRAFDPPKPKSKKRFRKFLRKIFCS